jgi:hypothetical protein
VATELEVLLIDDVELGGDVLEIGDALGVGTLDEILDMVGDFGGEFLNNTVVLNGDDRDKGGYKGNFGDFVLGEVFVFDFDDAFAAEFLAAEVVADEDFVFIFFEAKDADDLVDRFGGYVVDDGAVLDGADDHFFLAFHNL